MIPIKGYCTFDPLKTAIVGDVFPIEKFKHIKEDKVLSPLSRVIDETKEDLENLSNTLKKFGVEVHRPNMSETADDLSTYRRKPPQQTRDDMAVVGEGCFVANNLPEYHYIFANIDSDKMYYPERYMDYTDPSFTYELNIDQNNIPDQQRLLSTSFIHLLGKDIFWGTNTPGWKDSPIIRHHKQLWESQGFRVNIQATEEMGGHGDATWCILKPGVIVTLHDLQNYAEKFPGWDILYLEDKYWDQLSPFRTMKKKVGGKWWIQGEEHNDELINYVESWLGNWVGYCEETVFEVNMLSINPELVLVNSYNERVFNFLKKHKIEPVICTQRHRWFWDGGVHCLTQDLYREGEQHDYFS
jgi:hypothetical protein